MAEMLLSIGGVGTNCLEKQIDRVHYAQRSSKKSCEVYLIVDTDASMSVYQDREVKTDVLCIREKLEAYVQDLELALNECESAVCALIEELYKELMDEEACGTVEQIRDLYREYIDVLLHACLLRGDCDGPNSYIRQLEQKIKQHVEYLRAILLQHKTQLCSRIRQDRCEQKRKKSRDDLANGASCPHTWKLSILPSGLRTINGRDPNILPFAA